jgi:uncharacterized protein YciI
MTGSVDMAYLPFLATMRSGRFGPPDPGGWSAELVAAHVAMNNDLIAEMTERIIDGEAVDYDNAVAVDESELDRYAGRCRTMAGLVGEVERTARRLAEAHRSLGDRADTVVRVRIRDGEDVHDGTFPIGAFIEGNAGRHLEAHHQQLRDLQGPWLADPPADFDTFQLVRLIRVVPPPVLDEAAAASLQRQHLGYFAKMRAAGYMMAAGPADGDEPVAGICIYRANSVDEARILAEDDPAVRAGRFTVEAMGWFTPKGALRTQ